jgi:hypothetical protein
MKAALGSLNRRCCPVVTPMGATGAKPLFDFSKPPRHIWKPCLRPGAPSRLHSATSSFSPRDSWANIPHSTAASWNDDSAKSVANIFAAPAATGITPIRSVLIASSLFRGIPATCRAALSRTSLKTWASRGINSISGGSDGLCRTFCDRLTHVCNRTWHGRPASVLYSGAVLGGAATGAPIRATQGTNARVAQEGVVR